MNGLVEVKKNNPVTTTAIVADGTKKTHESVIKLYRKYENEFSRLGRYGFEIQKTRGRNKEVAVLNEAQVYFLFTLFRNNDQVVAFKLKLVEEFMRMKEALMTLQIQKNSEEWKETRKLGKVVRKETTDMIQEFIRYSTGQGSKNAIRYYTNISNMENKALLILEQKFPNVRDMLTHHQLSTLKTADRVVYEALEDGMKQGLNYKDIYKLARTRIEALASIIRPTIVINQKEVKMLE